MSLGCLGQFAETLSKSEQIGLNQDQPSNRQGNTLRLSMQLVPLHTTSLGQRRGLKVPSLSFTGEQLCIYDFSQNMAWSGWKMAQCAKNLVFRLTLFLSKGVVITYIVQNRWNFVPRSECHRATTLFLWSLAKSLTCLVKNCQICQKSCLADEFSPYLVSLWPHTLTYMHQIWPKCSADIGQELLLMTFCPGVHCQE